MNPKEEVFLPLSERTTVFDVAGFAQRHWREHQFNALRIYVRDCRLTLNPCTYQPIAEEEIDRMIATFSTNQIRCSAILEHMFQCTRRQNPGKSFQEILYGVGSA